MDRRMFLKAMAGAAGAVALGACSEGDGRGGGGAAGGRPTIRVAGGSMGFPSPFAYVAGPGYWRMSYVFDTLLWADSTGEELPWLASGYKRSEDGMAFTIELREVAWTDGRPLTARDVAFTFDYFASHQVSPLVIGTPHNVAKVIPTGERTVEIRLERPEATFVQSVLGTVPIAPEHVWSKISDPLKAFGDEALISTGPYRLEERTAAQGRELYVANDKYFLGPPFVRRIEMVGAADELEGVRLGTLDGASTSVEGTRNDVLAPFRDHPDFGVLSNPTGFGFPLFWNMSRGGALADLRFRQACLQAIDRNDIVRRLLTGNGEPGSAGFLPPGHSYFVKVDDYPYDPGAAARKLDDAGYRRTASGAARQGPDGKPLRFTLFLPNTVPPALPELVAANLREVGIELDLQVIDLVRLFSVKNGGNYDMLITLYPGPVGVGPNGDPDILRGIYHSNPPNPFHQATGYANPEVDRLLDQQVATYDEAERKQLVGEIQRVVARDLPVAMLYYTTMFFVYRKSKFDQWYYTKGGFGPGIPDIYNKHAFVTGHKTGLEVRKAP